METNSIYYTFSTIPQVLAGMIALLGAFWIYRIEILNKKLKSTSRTTLRELGLPLFDEKMELDKAKEKNRDLVKKGLIKHGNIENNRLTDQKAQEWIDRLSIRMNSSIEQDDYQWIENAIILVDRYVNNEISNKTKMRFDSLKREKKCFTVNIKTSIFLTLTTIAFNISILPFTKFVYDNYCLTELFLLINAILLLACLTYIGYSVIKTLNIKNVS